MYFINHSRINSILAGFLAAAIMALPLAGCAQTAAIHESSSQTVSSSVRNSSAASQINPSAGETGTAQQGSKGTDAASKAKASSPAAQNLKKVAHPQTSSQAQTLKKISYDALADNGAQFSITQNMASVVKPHYTYVDQREGYNYLPDLVSRNVYKQIFQSVNKISATPTSEGYYPVQKITVSGTRISEAQLRVILLAFLNDNPQVFWLANAYSLLIMATAPMSSFMPFQRRPTAAP